MPMWWVVKMCSFYYGIVPYFIMFEMENYHTRVLRKWNSIFRCVDMAKAYKVAAEALCIVHRTTTTSTNIASTQILTWELTFYHIQLLRISATHRDIFYSNRNGAKRWNWLCEWTIACFFAFTHTHTHRIDIVYTVYMW